MGSGLRAQNASGKAARLLWQAGLRVAFIALGTWVLRMLGFEFALLETLAAAACASIVAASVTPEADRPSTGKHRGRRE